MSINDFLLNKDELDQGWSFFNAMDIQLHEVLIECKVRTVSIASGGMDVNPTRLSMSGPIDGATEANLSAIQSAT